MLMKEIKIKKCFKKHYPRPEKLELKEKYLLKHNRYKDPIVINEKNELIDGYITYILSHFHQKMPIVLKRIGNIDYYVFIKF